METCQYRFTAYLMSSIKHERMRYCERWIRQTNREVLLDEPDFEKLSYEQDLLHNVNRYSMEFENEQLGQALTKLSEQEQRFLSWKFILQLKHSEIAGRLGISKAAADKRYQRILQKLRKEYFNGRI